MVKENKTNSNNSISNSNLVNENTIYLEKEEKKQENFYGKIFETLRGDIHIDTDKSLRQIAKFLHVKTPKADENIITYKDYQNISKNKGIVRKLPQIKSYQRIVEKDYKIKRLSEEKLKERNLYKSPEEKELEKKLDSLLVTPEIRYEKYKKLVSIDNRMWPLKYHALYLLSNHMMMFLCLSWVFRSLKMKNRILEANVYSLPAFSMMKPKFYIYFAIYPIAFIACYYYSRIYLFDKAYQNFYNIDLVSNQNFLDLFDTLMIQKRLRDER